MKSHQKIFSWGTLIFLFLGLRLGGLALFHPFFNNVCPIEEYYRGAIARELLNGLSMPYWEYRADNFGGGSVVISILTAGFFKLFGSSAFVLKSIPVLISLASLVLWFRILAREFSLKCAWYFTLFFIFSPAVFQSWSMVMLGDHYETIFLSALAVELFLHFPHPALSQRERGFERMQSSILLSPSKGERTKVRGNDAVMFALFGLLCGFGVWFAYIFVLTVAALVLLWIRKNPRLLTTREFWIFAGGFSIGFSPWIFFNLQNSFKGLIIHGIPLWHHVQHYPILSAIFWKKYFLKTFFVYDLFGIFSFPDFGWHIPRLLVNYLYVFLLAAPAVTWFSLRPKSTRHSDVSIYFLFYAILHCMAVQLTDFVGNRYMMPLMPAIFFAWARVIELLEAHSPAMQRAVRIFFVAPLLGLGAILWISMISPAYAGFLMKTPGVAYDYMASVPACNAITGVKDVQIDHCLRMFQTVSKNIPPENQKGLWTSLALNMAEIAVSRNSAALAKRLEFPDPMYTASFYFHFGRFLFYYRGHDEKDAMMSLKSFFVEGTPIFKLASLGISYALENENPDFSIRNTYDQPITGPRQFLEMKNLSDRAERRLFFQGVGRAYEISRLFFPAPCESWSCEYFREESNPENASWIQEGRERIKTVFEEFRK